MIVEIVMLLVVFVDIAFAASMIFCRRATDPQKGME